MTDPVLRVLDLFAGRGTATQPFKDLRWERVTVELESKYNPDICADILNLDRSQWTPGEFDFVWASPPCRVFSKASGGRHFTRVNTWEKIVPKTADAIEGVNMMKKTFELISYLKPDFSVVENPVSILRQLIGPPAVTTAYCRWGLPYLKRTDLWGDLPPGIDWKDFDCVEGREPHQLLRDVSDPVKRAEVPYLLGLALAQATEEYYWGDS